jgi:hypothetical protein
MTYAPILTGTSLSQFAIVGTSDKTSVTVTLPSGVSITGTDCSPLPACTQPGAVLQARLKSALFLAMTF